MSTLPQWLTASAATVGAILGLLGYLKGRTTHDLVNSISEQKLLSAEQKGFDAGVVEGRFRRLEQLIEQRNGMDPSGPPLATPGS